MGNTLHDQGQLEKAIEAFKKAILIRPDYNWAWNNLFFSLQASKKDRTSGENQDDFQLTDNGSKEAKIALSVLQYKLNRGQESEKIYLNRALTSLSNNQNLSIPNPSFDETRIAEIDLPPKKIVTLVHFGRSGTGLMHSRIDGHPEISTLPSIYFSEYFDPSTWIKITSAGWNGMINRFISKYEVLFDASSSVPIETKSKKLKYNIGIAEGMADVGDYRNEILKVDKALFKAEMDRLLASYKELNAFLFFKLVHVAYSNAIKDKNNDFLPYS